MTAVRCIEANDPDFPDGLTELSDRPLRIYLCGRLPAPRAVAIVGARRASEAGRRIAYQLGVAAAEAGAWTISGGALGIDAAAHRGALDGGGQTFAVLGGPATHPSPRQNRPLFQAMREAGGGYLSEGLDPPDRLAFCRRNRLIAALAPWVVVVEGQARSGTRYTLQAGRRLGRSLAAVTWAPGDPRGEQAVWVFARGGTPLTSADDMLRLFGWRRRRSTQRARAPASGETTVALMAAAWGLTAAQTLSRLTELELDGRAENLGGGRFRLR